jgi:aryl-alcohol dehydrogenase-like predicted oxidoreductase
MPWPATIQNSFSLLNRDFEGALAEACAPSNLNVGLLPWSILAGGVLTGKYSGLFNEDGTVQREHPSISGSRYGRFTTFQVC